MIDRLNELVAKLASWTLLLLVMLVVYDAIMRYAFHSGNIALQELEWHLFDIVVLLGIGYALQKNLHVRVDIFYDRYPKRLQRFVDIVALTLFILPFSLLIVSIGYDFTMLSFSQLEGSSNPGGLPYRFIVKSLIPLTFILLVLQVFSDFFKAFRELRR